VRFASEHGQPEVLYTILGLALNPARRKRIHDHFQVRK
jgi:hypothetical protein